METPIRQTVDLTVQPRGAVLGGVGVAMIIAGLWRVDGVLAALGVAAWLLLALAWWLARKNPALLELTLHGPEKTQAGTVFPLIITLANPRKWLDAFGVRIELHLARKTRTGGMAAWIPAGSAADLELQVAVEERTKVLRHRVRLVSDFPFGLYEVVRELEVDHPLCVVPRVVVPCGLSFAGGLLDAPQAAASMAGEAPGEPHGLRAWRPGDSPRRIAWQATLRSLARGAEIMIRQTDPPGFHPPTCAVVFHSFGTEGLIQPDRFERALSLAAGTLRHLHENGLKPRFIADFEGWKPHPAGSRAQLAACMELLAGAKRESGTEAHDLQAALAGIGEDEGLVVLSDMPPSNWRGSLDSHRAFVPEIGRRHTGKETRR